MIKRGRAAEMSLLLIRAFWGGCHCHCVNEDVEELSQARHPESDASCDHAFLDCWRRSEETSSKAAKEYLRAHARSKGEADAKEATSTLPSRQVEATKTRRNLPSSWSLGMRHVASQKSSTSTIARVTASVNHANDPPLGGNLSLCEAPRLAFAL